MSWRGHLNLAKITIFMKALAIVIVLLIFRVLIDSYNLDILPDIGLIGFFVTGELFVIGIITNSALSDFEESEKIVDDLQAAITNLFLYSKHDLTNDDKMVALIQSHVQDLLSAVNSNFKRNEWKREEIHSKIYTIVKDLKRLKERNVEAPFITTLQTELMNITRTLNRIETIMTVKFVPSVYVVGYVTTGVSVLLLLFVRIVSSYEALFTVGSISFVLIILVLLIRDMENPFEVDKNTVADVDLSRLFDLQEHLRSLSDLDFE
jgi:predicted membrane chloride channel (bestrophin family)